MAKLFTVDVSAIPTHEERYKIMEKFHTSFDVYENWVNIDLSPVTIYNFDVFWPYESNPPFPELPPNITIKEK